MIYKIVKTVVKTETSFPVYLEAASDEAAVELARGLPFVFQAVKTEVFGLRVTPVEGEPVKCPNAIGGV